MVPSSEKSEYHAWKPYFFWLLLKVYFLRLMAYVEVALTDKLRPHPGNDVRIERVKFPSRDKGRSIVAYVYTPVDLPEGYRAPVHLNIHGSGFGRCRWPMRGNADLILSGPCVFRQLALVLLPGGEAAQVCGDRRGLPQGARAPVPAAHAGLPGRGVLDLFAAGPLRSHALHREWF